MGQRCVKQERKDGEPRPRDQNVFCRAGEVPRLRRLWSWLLTFPALTGWANLWRTSGAQAFMLVSG